MPAIIATRKLLSGSDPESWHSHDLPYDPSSG